MRTMIAVLVALLSTAALAKSEDRQVPPFDSVNIASGIRARIEIGPQRPVHLEGEDSVLSQIETVVEDGALHIGFKSNSWWDGNHRAVRVTIQTPELRAIGASGGAMVEAQLTRADRHEINASGGSHVRVRGVDARELSLHGSGGASLEVSGRADDLELQLSGGSQLHGSALEVKNVEVQESGGSWAELRATGRIRGGLSGASELRARGGARARVSTSGSSSVDVED